jgi:hypothetical protein
MASDIQPARPAPRLEVVLELEEQPLARVFAANFEDERRLRWWLALPSTRSRLLAAILEVFDRLADAA